MPPIVFHFRLLLFFYWFLKNVELYHRPCHFGPRAKDVFWGIVLLRVCSLLLFHVVQFFKCWWIYLELNSKWLYLQSQTKIVGTLVQNPFFFVLVLLLSLSKWFIAVSHQTLCTNIEGTRRHKSVPTIMTETVV